MIMTAYTIQSPLHRAAADAVLAFFASTDREAEGLSAALGKLREALEQPNSLTIKAGPEPLYPTREAALAAPGEVYAHRKGGVYRVVGRFMWANSGPQDEKEALLYEHLFPNAHALYGRTGDEFFEIDPSAGPRFTRSLTA